MVKVHGVHEIVLKRGVSGEEFERYFTQEVLPAAQPSGVRVHLWKGDRGERAGQYALVIEIDSVETRDQHFPAEGGIGEEAQHVYLPQGSRSLFEKWESFASAPGDEITPFTDYVTIGE